MAFQHAQPPVTGAPETPQAGFSATVTDTTLSEALITLRKRRWILIIAVLLGLLYGIWKAETQPRVYEAFGRIQVRSGSSNEYRVSAVPGYSNDTASKMLTEIAILQSNMHIVLVPKTDIIRISYNSLNAKLAADIVNKVMSTYIQRSYETRFASTQRVSQWLSSQLDDLKQQVQVSQERMMDLQRRLGILGFDPTHNQISTSLEDLSKSAGEANRVS